MTTRIGTYGATQGYISELMAIQTRLQNSQTQVSTGLKSTSYSGIAADAADVLNLNNQLTMSQQFVSDNGIASTKLTAASDAISSIQTTINHFNTQLNSFISGNTKDPASIATLQNMAFQSLQSMQAYLGANIGGDFLFSGGRVTTNPMQLPATSLAQFQSIYNGTSTTYPSSRTTDLAGFTLGSAQTGPLTINSASGTITAATAGAFLGVPVGTPITLGGLVPATPVTVASVSPTGDSITVAPPSMVSETDASATIGFGATSLSSTQTGTLTISASNGVGTITPTTVGSLAALTPGTVFSLNGSSNNNGTYVVASNNGTSVTVSSAPLNQAVATSGDVTSTLTDGTTATTSAGYGSLSFGANSNGQITITASTPNAFLQGTRYPAGATLTVTGSSPNGNNDGQYTVLSNDGTSMAVVRKPPMPANSSTGIVATTTEIAASLVDTSTGAPAITNSSGGGGGGYGILTIATGAAAGQVTLTGTSPLTGVAVGNTLTIAGASNSDNDGTYQVVGVAGNTVTLAGGTSLVPPQLSTAATINGGSYGNLTMSSSNGNLTVTAANALAPLAVGSAVTIAGSTPTIGGVVGAPGVNDGTFVVTNVVGTSMTLATTSVTLGGAAAVTAAGYGNLTFGSNASGQMTLTAGTPGAFTGIYAPGSTITITGSVPNGTSDGTYIVAGNSAPHTQLTLYTTPTTVAAGIAPTNNETTATLADFTTGAAALTNATYGTMSIGTNSSGQMIVSASNAASLNGIRVGDTIHLALASNANNDGYYYVQQNNSGTLTLATAPPVVSANSWYKGDTLGIQQPISTTTNVGIGVFASDPAFEKAIRAMAIIAQGTPNSPGGLAANQSRIKVASYLVGSALGNPGVGSPPPPLTGTEDSSNVVSLSSKIGFDLADIDQQTTSETQLQGFIQTRLASVENEDPTTAITNLEADATSLQASYQSLAQLFSLSLLNYIK